MTIRWLVAVLHLLGLGIGLGAVWARARALRQPLDRAGLSRVMVADAWWGIAALLWLATGLYRVFGELEKTTAYYAGNLLFWHKMGGFLVIFLLELQPMVGLTRWRARLRRGEEIDISRAGRYATISTVQAILVIVLVILATGMARGVGMIRGTTG